MSRQPSGIGHRVAHYPYRGSSGRRCRGSPWDAPITDIGRRYDIRHGQPDTGHGRFTMRASIASGNTPILLTMLLAVGTHGSPLAGQSARFTYEVAAGVAVPTGILGRTGGAGPLVRASISRGRDTTVGVRFRFDAEAMRISTITSPKTAPYSGDGLQAYSLVGNWLFGPDGAAIAPYLLGGVGLQFAASQTPDSYPGLFTSVRLGVGLRGIVRRFRVSLEFTSAGAVRNYRGGAYWPITLGLAF